MGTIIKNAIRERMRRKEAYVVLAIALFLLLFCSGENSTIMIDGESLTGFHNMFMVMHVLVHAAGCILAVLLSYRTIPNEYARKTSHLVWVRGISQPIYHGGLTIANILASIGGLGLLYLAMAVYALLQGQSACALRLIPGFFVMAASVALVSLWTSVVSIRLPAGIAAAFGVLGAGTGVLWSALDLLRSSLGGTFRTYPCDSESEWRAEMCIPHSSRKGASLASGTCRTVGSMGARTWNFCNPAEGGIKI